MKKHVFLLIFIIAAVSLQAQNITLPEASQKAQVMQRIGLTDITIDYHSPLVKGRPVWGTLVPYNEVWRAGANENTVITFSTDVMVEGEPLKAGAYGLHMIPTEKNWTVIFSKNATSWGSFFYDKSEDALRIVVNPVQTTMQDWLSYSFADVKPNAATAEMHWEKLIIPFVVSVDLNTTVLQNIRTELRGTLGFTWQGFQQAAAFCVRNNVSLEEGLKWADKSISIQKTFGNLRTKSQLLTKLGKTEEGSKLMAEAMTMADEAQLNAYGYDLMGSGKINDAIDIFKMNVKRYPNSWNTYDSLGEAFQISGDKKQALTNYKTALSKAPADQQSRINGIIKTLEAK
jgi:tetratricopeptide (TPR) repeat protein